MQTQTQLIVRVDVALKNKISRLAKSEGKSLSEVLRELMADYVKERDISNYIEDLWDAMGREVEARGYDVRDIDDIIQQVRTENDQSRT